MSDKIYAIVVIGLCIIVLFMVLCPDTEQKVQNVSMELDKDNKLDETIVKAGQIWLSETEDPFKEDIYWYIIEIKEGYVKFCSIEYNKEEEHWEIPRENAWISSEINLFTRIYKRIK